MSTEDLDRLESAAIDIVVRRLRGMASAHNNAASMERTESMALDLSISHHDRECANLNDEADRLEQRVGPYSEIGKP